MENGDIASIISKIVENPEFAGMVNEIKGKSGGETSTDDIMASLPQIMSMVSPMLDSSKPHEERAPVVEEKHANPSNNERAVSALASKAGKYDKARATKLMQALKPYLTHERAEIIDKCVSVMQISDIVGSLGGLSAIENLLK